MMIPGSIVWGKGKDLKEVTATPYLRICETMIPGVP